MTSPTDASSAERILEGLGGPGNIVRVSADHTRTNVWLHDTGRIDHPALRAALVHGFLARPGHVQLVTGARTADVAAVLERSRRASRPAVTRAFPDPEG